MATQKPTQKTQYFNPDNFIDMVIKDMKLGDTKAETVDALRDEIERMLSDRIISTVLGAFSKHELELFEKILEDHPELDEVDALMVLAPTIEGVKEQLERAINSLYFELVHEANQVDIALDQKAAA